MKINLSKDAKKLIKELKKIALLSGCRTIDEKGKNCFWWRFNIGHKIDEENRINGFNVEISAAGPPKMYRN